MALLPFFYYIMEEKNIKLEQFEGPLALLLQVIEKEELDITEVSIAKVTDQYIKYLELQENLHPDEIANFLVIATKLLYIKSKVLSPDYFIIEEREESDLARQLKMYKEYVEVSKHISNCWKSDQQFFSREKSFKLPQQKFVPPKHISLKEMNKIMNRVIAYLEPIAKLKVKRMDITISIKDKIKNIKEIIQQQFDYDFHSLISEAKNKTEKIVSFLAVLELVKQREVEVIQEVIFENFVIKKSK